MEDQLKAEKADLEPASQQQVPPHEVVELEPAASIELDNAVTHKMLAQSQQKIALREMQDAQKDEVRWQRQETILVARAAAAAGITSFKGAKVIGRGKVAFIL